MGIDSALSEPEKKVTPERPAIENELPAYRAITPLAIGSLLAGLAGLLTFANLAFIAASVGGILLGILAIRQIRKQPDAFTGLGFAKAGIVLGLVSGLSAVTMSATQSFVTARGAEQFAKNQLIPLFQDRDIDSALWWRESPDGRKGLTPEDVHKRYSNPNQGGEAMFEMMAGSVARLMKELKAEPGAKVTFERVEQISTMGITPVAVITARIEWPPHEHKEGETHQHGERGERIAIVAKCKRDGRREDWWVDDYVYPYVTNTYQEKMKAPDDGHGHSH